MHIVAWGTLASPQIPSVLWPFAITDTIIMCNEARQNRFWNKSKFAIYFPNADKLII